MGFKLPPGQLRWLSICWAVLGLAGAVYFSLVAQHVYPAAICVFVLMMTLGIWLG